MPFGAANQLLALYILLAIGAILVLWLIVAVRRSELSAVQWAAYLLNLAVNKLLWRTRVVGDPVPKGQGAIIICNHRSSVDPCFLQLASGPRVVHWMVAKEYFSHPAFGLWLRMAECIPVGRGGIDTAATKMAIRYAREGGLVGMLPEGRINTTDQLLLPGRPGVAMVALKARVPVIPCYLEGVPYGGTPLSSLLMPAKVRVVVGRPIDLSDYYGREKEEGIYQQLTKRFLSEIAALAGVPDYVPELAGKRWLPEGE